MDQKSRESDVLTQRINKIEKDLFGFKASQLSGSGNTYSYIAETNNTWDCTVTATSVGASDYAKRSQLFVTFTADHKPAAFTTFEVDVTIDGVPYYLSPKSALGSYDADCRSTFYEQSDGNKDVAKYQQGYLLVVGANGSVGNPTTIRVKVRAVSVDTGTLTVREVIIS